jgi:hypothetical protein
MSKDYILHFQPEIPQIIVGQEASDGQMCILNVISGHETLELIDHLVGGGYHVNKGRTKKA